MKQLIPYRLLMVFFLFSIAVVSCKNDIDLSNIDNNILINESLVVPLGEASVSVLNVINKYGTKNTVTFAGDENIYLQIFDSTEYSLHDYDLTSKVLPINQNLIMSDLQVAVIPPMIVSTINVPSFFLLGFNTSGQSDRLHRVTLKDAQIKFNVNLSPDLLAIPPSNLSFRLIFPTDRLIEQVPTNTVITPSGYGQDFAINYGQLTFNTDTIINGVKQPGATTLPFMIEIKVKGIDKPILITPNLSAFSYSMQFTSMNFEVIFGKFRPKLVNNSVVKLPLKINEILPNAFLRFANPQIYVKSTSSLGANMKFQIDYLKAYTIGDASSEKYAWFNGHTTKSRSEVVGGPLNYGDAPVVQNLSTFDKTNGEIDKLFDTQPYPNQIEYMFSVDEDPNTNRSEVFVASDSKVKVNVEVRVPVELKNGSYFELNDSILNVNSTIGKILDDVDSAILVLNITNSLPLKAKYLMTFWNAAEQKITTTIANEYTLNSPDVDVSGNVIVPATGLAIQQILVKLNKTQISDLKNTSKIKFTLRVDGKDVAAPIHITRTNSIKVKFGVFVNASTTQNLGKK